MNGVEKEATYSNLFFLFENKSMPETTGKDLDQKTENKPKLTDEELHGTAGSSNGSSGSFNDERKFEKVQHIEEAK